MGLVLVSGAKLMCPFGTAPSTLTTTSQVNCMGCSKPIATITDTSMTPFGMCASMTNPQVAAATAAALGVLTPQPCTFVPAGAWRAGQSNVLIGGKTVLTTESTITCGMGMGNISITSPGQSTLVIG